MSDTTEYLLEQGYDAARAAHEARLRAVRKFPRGIQNLVARNSATRLGLGGRLVGSVLGRIGATGLGLGGIAWDLYNVQQSLEEGDIYGAQSATSSAAAGAGMMLAGAVGVSSTALLATGGAGLVIVAIAAGAEYYAAENEAIMRDNERNGTCKFLQEQLESYRREYLIECCGVVEH